MEKQERDNRSLFLHSGIRITFSKVLKVMHNQYVR